MFLRRGQLSRWLGEIYEVQNGHFPANKRGAMAPAFYPDPTGDPANERTEDRKRSQIARTVGSADCQRFHQIDDAGSQRGTGEYTIDGIHGTPCCHVSSKPGTQINRKLLISSNRFSCSNRAGSQIRTRAGERALGVEILIKKFTQDYNDAWRAPSASIVDTIWLTGISLHCRSYINLTEESIATWPSRFQRLTSRR